MISTIIALVITLSLVGSTDSPPQEEWMPLCQKVEKADLVFEATFEVPKEKPSPEVSLAEVIVQSGKISRVIKGELVLEAPWDPSFGKPFDGYIDGYLEKLIEGKTQIRRVVFLKKIEAGYIAIAGAEAQLGCQSSSHISWCPSYVDYWKQTESCFTCLKTNFIKYPRCY